MDVDWRIPAGGQDRLVVALTRLCGPRRAGRPGKPRGGPPPGRGGPVWWRSGRPLGRVPGMGQRTILHCGPPLRGRGSAIRCGALSWRRSWPRAGRRASEEPAPWSSAARWRSSRPTPRHRRPDGHAPRPVSARLSWWRTAQAATGPSPASTRVPARTPWFGVDDTGRRSSGCASCATSPARCSPPRCAASGPVDVFAGRPGAPDGRRRPHAHPGHHEPADPRTCSRTWLASDGPGPGARWRVPVRRTTCSSSTWRWRPPRRSPTGRSEVAGLEHRDRHGPQRHRPSASGWPGSGEWFLAPAPPVGHALYHPGYGPADGAPDIGDSAVLELVGLGGPAAAAPRQWRRSSAAAMAEAVAATETMDRICAGRSSRFKLPFLDLAARPSASTSARSWRPGSPRRSTPGSCIAPPAPARSAPASPRPARVLRAGPARAGRSLGQEASRR